jgi:hypothetical protein
MRVPEIHYRKTEEPEGQRIDVVAAGIFWAGLLMSAGVWALAIAKVIEFYGVK